VIERDRRSEIEALEAATRGRKSKTVQDRIAAEESDVASLQKQLDQTSPATSRQLGN